MEKIFTRYVVTMVFALWASACFADVDENFNSLEVGRSAVLGGWTLTKCQGAYHGGTPLDKSNMALFLLQNSVAVMPIVGKDCNALLTFSYRNAKDKANSAFTVSLNGDAKFEGNESVKNISITTGNSTDYQHIPLCIYGAKTETVVTFTINSLNNYVIDDVKLTTSTPVSISETGTATTFDAQLADVTLGRTLSAGVWSTR